MSPSVRVDTTSGVPPWRQVHDQLRDLAGSTVLPVGAVLPPIRQLAGELGLGTSTVARAYRELEAAGVLTTARRRGTVVARPATDPGVGALLDAAAARFATEVAELPVEPGRALAAVRRALDGLDPVTS